MTNHPSSSAAQSGTTGSSSTTSTSSNSPSSDLERAKAQGRDSVAELQEQMKILRSDLQAMKSTAMKAGSDQLHTAREAASDTVERGKERFMEGRDELDAWVRAHPLKAVAVAAGAGALWGLMAGRR